MMRRTARLLVGGNVHGDVKTVQDTTVELLKGQPAQ